MNHSSRSISFPSLSSSLSIYNSLYNLLHHFYMISFLHHHHLFQHLIVMDLLFDLGFVLVSIFFCLGFLWLGLIGAFLCLLRSLNRLLLLALLWERCCRCLFEMRGLFLCWIGENDSRLRRRFRIFRLGFWLTICFNVDVI